MFHISAAYELQSSNIQKNKGKMEEGVCMYKKYCFCKYKEDCQKSHLTEECKDLASCKIKKSCNKRHPNSVRKIFLKHFVELVKNVNIFMKKKKNLKKLNKKKN